MDTEVGHRGALRASLVAVACLVAGACAVLPATKPVASQADGASPAPFVAKGTVEVRRTLGDGTTQSYTFDTSYARDAQGRMRAEGIIYGETTTDAEGGTVPVQYIEISDPVAKASWKIYPQSGQVIRRDETPAPVIEIAGWQPSPVMVGVTQETQLGMRVIDGIEVNGTRTTDAGTSEAVGVSTPGAAPIVNATTKTTESWRAPSLGVALEEARTSPDGTTEFSFRATDVKLGDPPASLFAPPPSATVHDVSPNRDEAVAMFREAKTDLQGLPDLLAASELATISGDEIRAMQHDKEWQAQARQDAMAAFGEIVSTVLPPLGAPAQGTRPGVTPPDPKATIERNLISDLLLSPYEKLTPEDYSAVLNLIRSADVIKAPLYDYFIESVFRPGANAGGLFDPIALAKQCQQLDGSFPYNGALVIARSQIVRPGRAPIGQESTESLVDTGTARELLSMAFSAAASETEPSQLPSAFMFLLQTAPRPNSAPGVGDITGAFGSAPDWESAVEAQLRRNSPGSLPQVAALAMRLAAFDPDAAAQFGAYNSIQAGSAQAPMSLNGSGVLLPTVVAGPIAGRTPAAQPLSPLLLMSDPAAALAAAQAETGQAALNDTINVAGIASMIDPATAGAAAVAADDEIDAQGAPLSSMTLNLSQALDRLGMEDRAEALAARNLEQAAKDADATQARFDQLSPDQQSAQLAFDVGGIAVNAFRSAASIDFAMAADAAGALRASVVKPLALSAVASVAH